MSIKVVFPAAAIRDPGTAVLTEQWHRDADTIARALEESHGLTRRGIGVAGSGISALRNGGFWKSIFWRRPPTPRWW